MGAIRTRRSSRGGSVSNPSSPSQTASHAAPSEGATPAPHAAAIEAAAPTPHAAAIEAAAPTSAAPEPAVPASLESRAAAPEPAVPASVASGSAAPGSAVPASVASGSAAPGSAVGRLAVPSASAIEAAVLEAVSLVCDPEYPQVTIAELGMVYRVAYFLEEFESLIEGERCTGDVEGLASSVRQGERVDRPRLREGRESERGKLLVVEPTLRGEARERQAAAHQAQGQQCRQDPLHRRTIPASVGLLRRALSREAAGRACPRKRS